MRQLTSTTTSSVGSRVRVAVRSDDEAQLIRGLVNGVVLSLAIWLTAGYIAFMLR